MSSVIFIWSVAAGAALTLGLVHALVWIFDRTARANLMFALVAVSFIGIAVIELKLMHAVTAGEYAAWVRWSQVPIFGAIVGLVLFIRYYFGTATPWLGWTVVSLRAAIVVATIFFGVNFNFREIASIVQVPFLGESVSAVGQATTGEWQWLAVVSIVLLVTYAIDASVRLWRQGEAEARRRALVIGGSVVAFYVLASGQSQLVIFGLAQMPILLTPAFLIMLVAMGSELSREVLHAARLARELRDRDDQLELAADAAGLGLWVWNVATRSLQATDRVRTMFGIQKNRPIDIDAWCAAIHPDDVAAVRSGLERALATGEEFVGEFRTNVGNDMCWIAARGRMDTDKKGAPTLMRGVARDITEAKLAQDEARELRRDLAHAGRVTVLGQLSASFAHELNQPLGAILRNAEAAAMLLERPNPDVAELREILADIRKDDRRAGKVIESLRALLRRRSMEMQPLQLETVVRDVIAIVRGDAAGKHVALDFIAQSSLPPTLGDRVHLSQVLLNLIMNGVDAAQESRKPSPRVTVDATCSDGLIEVAVTDSGNGIPTGTLDRVFEPFFTTKTHGMGMGLPVSRTIVEAHGGKLWAENNGTGATFRFTVPVVG